MVPGGGPQVCRSRRTSTWTVKENEAEGCPNGRKSSTSSLFSKGSSFRFHPVR